MKKWTVMSILTSVVIFLMVTAFVLPEMGVGKKPTATPVPAYPGPVIESEQVLKADSYPAPPSVPVFPYAPTGCQRTFFYDGSEPLLVMDGWAYGFGSYQSYLGNGVRIMRTTFYNSDPAVNKFNVGFRTYGRKSSDVERLIVTITDPATGEEVRKDFDYNLSEKYQTYSFTGIGDFIGLLIIEYKVNQLYSDTFLNLDDLYLDLCIPWWRSFLSLIIK